MNRLKLRLKSHLPDPELDYLVTELLIDDAPFVDFDYYATDLNQLLHSCEQDGEYFIVTCWCGVPSCAGVQDGIQVQHRKNIVYWHPLKPLPTQSLLFEREAYQQAIQHGIKQIKRTLIYQRSTNEWKIDLVPKLNLKLVG